MQIENILDYERIGKEMRKRRKENGGKNILTANRKKNEIS